MSANIWPPSTLTFKRTKTAHKAVKPRERYKREDRSSSASRVGNGPQLSGDGDPGRGLGGARMQRKKKRKERGFRYISRAED